MTRIYLFFLLIFVVLLTSLNGQIKSTDNEIKFNIIINPNSVTYNNNIITERMTFVSEDKVKIFVLITHYKTVADVEKNIKQQVATLDKCESESLTLDAEGNKMGIRCICQNKLTGGKTKSFILYSYDTTLYQISSFSVEHLKIFEKDFCPHSGTIIGRKCPDVFLKKNWVRH